jgi:hypothetical protein
MYYIFNHIESIVKEKDRKGREEIGDREEDR